MRSADSANIPSGTPYQVYDKGRREVECEGHSRNNDFGSVWRGGMLNEGDLVTLTVEPMKNGSDGGYVPGVTTPDGTSF